jgi:fructose/tagatose bisphosphate aldolase
MTNPDEVAEFVDRSGCDLWAVAVGNVHGRYRVDRSPTGTGSP